MFGDQITYAADGTPIYDSIIPTMLSGLPDILLGIVVVLVLSASMSTLSSLVLTSSSSLTLDLLKGKVIKQMSENSQVLLDARAHCGISCFIFSSFLAFDSIHLDHHPFICAAHEYFSWGCIWRAHFF